jgi:thioredoxin reductase
MVKVLHRHPAMFDVIVVGGGPAGLSAALMLGRCRRRVLVCDVGQGRNRHSRALHGYLTRDGIPPMEFNELGRNELGRYGVECRATRVVDAERGDRQFTVSLEGGVTELSRFLLIATGVEDHVPEVDGLADCYGRSMFHCPYCDGWEWRDRRIAVFGSGKSGVALSLSMKTWSPHIALCTNGGAIGRGGRDRLRRNGVEVRPAAIARVRHDDGMLRALEFSDGSTLECDVVFFTTGQHQKCDIAVRLGCAFNERGTVETGSLSQTNVPGVFVAGDASHDAQFVVVAAAEGVKAAMAINQALQRVELAP